MRHVLVIATLFVCSTAVQGQEASQSPAVPAAGVPAQTDPVSATDRQGSPADMKTQSATAADVSAARVRFTAPADLDDTLVQQPPRNFWWLVGGIVLAGLILAILL